MAEATRVLGATEPGAAPSADPPDLAATASAAESREAPLPRGSPIGRYIVLECVGRGGMGVVYAAYDPELDRRVALKLMRPDRPGWLGEELRQRLQREAHAMARLSHPHIVAVYDVGTVGGQLFIAMEFVQGPTLTQWLAERPRGWREVLSVFLQAGTGLAAAHAAAIVHRDFKPDNVLLDAGGRARVSDFGIARAAGGKGGSAGPAPLAGAPSASVALTQQGTVLGTPRYMSPEQLRGEPADTRSDLFSFCVALFEALFGVPPFPGHTLEELRAAVESGKLAQARSGPRVPAWLRRSVLRGLSRDPGARPPSMEALLRSLTLVPARRRRFLAAGVALALLGGATALFAALRPPSPCHDSELGLEGIWDSPRRAALRAAFERTRAPYAATVLETTLSRLDTYAADWRAMRRAVCEATLVRREVPQEVMVARQACLDRRRQRLEALLARLAQADARGVLRAVEAVGSLPRVQTCARALAGEARAGRPGSRGAADETRRRLAQAEALLDTGAYREGLAAARLAFEAAKRIVSRRLRAEAGLVLASALKAGGDTRASIRTLEGALEDAVAAGDPLLLFAAARRLAFATGGWEQRPEEGHRWTRIAAAALEGRGGIPRSSRASSKQSATCSPSRAGGRPPRRSRSSCGPRRSRRNARAPRAPTRRWATSTRATPTCAWGGSRRP